MKKHLVEIPTMIEAKTLAKLEEIKKEYNEQKANGNLTFDTDFLVLRSKHNDFLAYFHDAKKTPSIKETVEWMEETDNLTFPGNVSIKEGIKNRYDEKYHDELNVVIPEVMDDFIKRLKTMSDLAENLELMDLIEEIANKIPKKQKPKLR